MTAYNIATYTQLKTIKDDLAGDYTLTADIDASASALENAFAGGYYGFAPIGTTAAPFTGTFDGGGFTISNLFINRPTTQYVGLFGVATKANGFIKNVKITNASITGSSIAGILAGQISGTAGNQYLVTDCIVSGTVSSASINGGLVGWSTYATYTDCSSDATITSSAGYGPFGGLMGYAANVDCVTCHSAGVIEVSNSAAGGSGFNAGGFVGQTYSTTCNFTSCYSTVSIIDNVITSGAGVGYSGGFVGYDTTGIYTYCYATGSIVSTNTYSVSIGGFAGWLDGSASQCAAFGDVNCNTASGTLVSASAGGFAGQVVSSTVANCYARGDVCKTGIGTPTNGYSVGGFIGSFGATVTITNCYSKGYVFPTASYSGGFSGGGTATTQTTCYWDKTTSGMTTSFGGTGKTTAEMKTLATFVSWDFTTIWDLLTYTQAGTSASNLTTWLGRVGDYENFEEGVKDDDAFSLQLQTQNEIRWVDAIDALLIGTTGDEWRIASSKLDTPLTLTNFTVRQQSEYGSAQIQPVKINSSLLYVDFVKRKLREMTYVDPKYESPDMTTLAEHITLTGITSMARQKNPDSIIWLTLTDGSLISMTYEREQNVAAWAKHPLGGDGVAQSVCVIPGATEDEIYLTVRRTINSTAVTYIEKMASRVFTAIADAFFVDCGITFTAGTATSTITGLTHLVGKTVKVLGTGPVIGNGIALDDAVVNGSGQITAKLAGVAVTVTKAQVGLPYTYKLQPMRIVAGSNEGTSMGSTLKVSELAISFLNTLAAKYGRSDADLKDINFSDERFINHSTITGLKTGEVAVPMPGGYDTEAPIIISGDGPGPCTVRAIVAKLSKDGR
ncbi:MAG: hypothetical protein IMZ61_06540 [Planctomycetes bacterium]|nr:hypothetical protein [Planctomycetota bacterium]